MAIRRLIRFFGMVALSMFLLGCSIGPEPTVIHVITPPPPTATPVLGVAIPGPQAQHIQSVVTSDQCDVTTHLPPLVTHFKAGSFICVAGLEPNATARHTVRCDWFLNGVHIMLRKPIIVELVPQGSGESVFYCGLTFPTSGLGVAKLYWDAPDTGGDQSPSDQFLAYSIAFAVD